MSRSEIKRPALTDLAEIIDRELPCKCPNENRFNNEHTVLCPQMHRDRAVALAKVICRDIESMMEEGFFGWGAAINYVRALAGSAK